MKQIVIVNNSWCFIGEVDLIQKDNESYYKVTKGSIIRVWGTTDGVGQLSIEGKLPDTILDKHETVYIPKGQVLFLMDVKEERWKDYFDKY